MTNEREQVIQEARRLLDKLRGEELCGTPVHPAGHPNAQWRLDDGYPAEYAALADALDGLSEQTVAVSKTLEQGYVVAITLKPDAAPLRSYVGEVQTIDGRGVRLTLVDWFTGGFSNWDLFVPWEQITSALVATPDHDVSHFDRAAGDWQQRMSNDTVETPAA